MEKHSNRAHALLSASGAAKWLNCPPSARLEEQIFEESSDYADEGTLAHELADVNLKYHFKQISSSVYLKTVEELEASEYYSVEMDEEVEKFTDYVKEQALAAYRTGTVGIFLEKKINLSAYIPEGFGTGDSIIIGGNMMEIIDLKYGKGVKVEAENNSQLKLYALGALDAYDYIYDIEFVTLTIVQPRLDGISSWIISVKDLKEWGKNYVKQQAQLAFAGKGDLKVGEWCRFCKAKPKCRAMADHTLEVAKAEFAKPKLLSDKEILVYYKEASIYIDWLNSITKYVLDEAIKGKEWPGFKVVKTQGNRKIINEEKVLDILINDLAYDEKEVVNKKLKGIGDLTKLLGKTKFNTELHKYIIRPEGKPTLVPINDSRPGIGLEQAKLDFK